VTKPTTTSSTPSTTTPKSSTSPQKSAVEPASATKDNKQAQSQQPEKELDWKKHVREYNLEEEATVNGKK
jgi:hypothetical protein